MKYTTNEVIELFSEYMQNIYLPNEWNKCLTEEKFTFPTSFETWLLDREKALLPVKDQLIWVKDFEDEIWVERQFSHFGTNDRYIWCYRIGEAEEKITEFIIWDEYSLTDPDSI